MIRHCMPPSRAAAGTRMAVLIGAIAVAVPMAWPLPANASDNAALALEVEHAVTRILALDGDPAYGEYLGGECVTCHQASGAASGIPPIHGLPVDYTVQAMVEYKLGTRTNPVMKLMTARLSDEEIAALAVYIADMEE
ncbi:c-type cytochrome [Aquibium carbonis]|uniref:c-type cytochrome n=1 Tax=Aquibium carbonis TaxID=2495581 RepID=UPI001AEC7A6D|nr:c-type cytochrome [Aquibium carbonis]